VRGLRLFAQKTGPASPREINAWRDKLRDLERHKDQRAVLAEAERMVRKHPRDADVLGIAAQVYEARGERERLIATLRALGEVKPRQAKVALRLARELAAEGHHDEAVGVLEPGVHRLVTAPDLTAVAAIYHGADRAEEAVPILRRALDQNPHYRPALDRLVAVLDDLGRPEERDEAIRARDAAPAKLSTAEVVRRVDEARGGERGFVVNIGCRDGRGMDDPCYELYEEGFPGVAVDAGDFPDLYRNLPQPAVRKLLNTMITPANVVGVLRSEGCPDAPVLVKIDIDGLDGVVLEGLLAGITPDVIQMEVNPEIPPPIEFAVEYHRRYKHGGTGGFFGCSVAFVVSLCRPLGYELLQIDLSRPPRQQDVIVVKKEHLPLFGVEAPVDARALFLREPVDVRRKGFRMVGADPAAWREIENYDRLLDEVRRACEEASIIRGGDVLPFRLSYGNAG
jgi:hypothetical protein